MWHCRLEAHDAVIQLDATVVFLWEKTREGTIYYLHLVSGERVDSMLQAVADQVPWCGIGILVDGNKDTLWLGSIT